MSNRPSMIGHPSRSIVAASFRAASIRAPCFFLSSLPSFMASLTDELNLDNTVLFAISLFLFARAHARVPSPLFGGINHGAAVELASGRSVKILTPLPLRPVSSASSKVVYARFLPSCSITSPMTWLYVLRQQRQLRVLLDCQPVVWLVAIVCAVARSGRILHCAPCLACSIRASASSMPVCVLGPVPFCSPGFEASCPILPRA